jgi:Protein tyrosine phosphatase-like protein, PTPLA
MVGVESVGARPALISTLIIETTLFSGACQAAALLETVHVLAGLVKGSAPLALLQWFGRSNVLFLILGAVPEVSARKRGMAGASG